MSETILSSIIASGSTIIGVILGTILTTTISKSYKRRLQYRTLAKEINLVIFSDIHRCFATQTAFRKDHDVNESITLIDLEKKVKNILASNITLLDKELYSIYYTLVQKEFFEDFSGFMYQVDFINTVVRLINQIIYYEKKFKLMSKNMYNKLLELNNCYKLWYLISSKSDLEGAYEFLSFKWSFNKPIKEIIKSKSFIEIHKKYDHEQFIEMIKAEFIKN